MEQKNELVAKPINQMATLSTWVAGFNQLVTTQGFQMTKEQKGFAVSAITALIDKCVKDKIDPNELNMTNFLEQAKHIGKLKLSFQENQIYFDIRNNKDTGKKDVAIRKQYQGIQHLMVMFSKKKIIRFADGIVCRGDDFDNEFDFDTGLTKLRYKPNLSIDHNELKNITNAFAIAYVEELGKLVPYVVVVNKQRIDRAYWASPSKDKTVWNKDTARMVRKTAYWCLYNDVFQPFIEIPSELQESFDALKEEMNFNNTEDNAVPTESINADFVVGDEFIPVEPVPEQQTEMEQQEFNYEGVDDLFPDTQPETESEEKEVYYSEYKNHPEKYNLVEGSYNRATKTCRVTLK